MRRLASSCLWWVFRAFGALALVFGVSFAILTLELENNYIPRSEVMPYLSTCMAFFCGSLVILPSTTPLWIKEIDSLFSSIVSIATIVGLSMALMYGVETALPIMNENWTGGMNSGIGALITFLGLVGVFTSAYLGLSAPRGPVRRVPVMVPKRKKRHKTSELRAIRKART